MATKETDKLPLNVFATEDPFMAIMDVLIWPNVTRTIQLLVEFGIADAIPPDGHIDINTLSSAVNVTPERLQRLLRIIEPYGYIEQCAPGMYSHTSRSLILRSDHPMGAYNVIRGSCSKAGWRAISYLDQSFKTGRDAFSCVPEHEGLKSYDWYAKYQPSEAENIARSMATQAKIDDGAIVSAYDFSSRKIIADIGGSSGTLIQTILRSEPTTNGILFDMATVIDAEKPKFPEDIRDRCTFVGGSFLDAIPPGADLYILKYIVHNWEDADAKKILRNCYDVMQSGAKILLCEMLIDSEEKATRQMANRLDLAMMVLTGGRERTKTEYYELLQGTGFIVDQVIGTISFISIIEATKP